ncbi:hypothetical protein [Bradyrhizobium sp. UFLA05-112]
MQAGEAVSGVARRLGSAQSLLFTWRRQALGPAGRRLGGDVPGPSFTDPARGSQVASSEFFAAAFSQLLSLLFLMRLEQKPLCGRASPAGRRRLAPSVTAKILRSTELALSPIFNQPTRLLVLSSYGYRLEILDVRS